MAQGHIRKRGKTWSYVVSITDPATGKQKRKWKGGFKTKRDAQRALREFQHAREHGTFVEPSKATYGEYVESVWLPSLKDDLQESTIDSYTRNIRLHVLPRIGGIALADLSPLHLNQLYQELRGQDVAQSGHANRKHRPEVYDRIEQLRKEGLTYKAIADAVAEEFPDEGGISRHAVARIVARAKKEPKQQPTLSIGTVRNIHASISRSLNDAIKVGFINHNPARNASPPKKSRARVPMQVWTGDETRRFLQWAKDVDHQLATAWAFVATSGDRRGGNLGLRWQDIDFDAGRAQLIWKVTCVAHKIVAKPYDKSGKSHEIIVDERTLAMLRAWRSRQNEQRLAAGLSHVCESPDPDCSEPGYHVRDLVFARPDGNYLHPERFSREFKRAQKRYNRDNPDTPLPEARLHALRHGWATTALEAGVPMKVVQDRLNHASERITADIYTHVRAPMQSDAAERVAERLLP